ncbi:hypothetical protein [Priestia abyssalis]|uniref:hypothetical protein n=1 Tax=Priestia abyssalis TaxID=1221450 RepID=UPI000994EDBE|nr:hypothetical protein [Priestia abyssalis]
MALKGKMTNFDLTLNSLTQSVVSITGKGIIKTVTFYAEYLMYIDIVIDGVVVISTTMNDFVSRMGMDFINRGSGSGYISGTNGATLLPVQQTKHFTAFRDDTGNYSYNYTVYVQWELNLPIQTSFEIRARESDTGSDYIRGFVTYASEI